MQRPSPADDNYTDGKNTIIVQLRKRCSGCKKDQDEQMFIDGETVRSTCSNCRSSNKIRKKHSHDLLQPENAKQLIEFEELMDELLFAMNEYTDLSDKENSNSHEVSFEFEKAINIYSLSGEPKTIADIIIEEIQNADEYKWNYSKYYQHKKSITSFWYICAQRSCTLKSSRKHSDINKQRDTTPKERFNCNGTIKILIDTSAHYAQINIKHDDLHILPNDFSIPDWVKNYISQNLDLFPRVIYAQLVSQGLPIYIRQKQIHYWWSHYMTQKYKRKEDVYDSACEWLYEKGYEIIVENNEPARALGFLTGFHTELQEKNIPINECGIDATYNTNNLTFELYVLHAEVDGTGYPLGYLLLDNNGNGVSGARTNIIARFLNEFKTRGISPQFLLTDKDFAQISASQMVWPNTKVQLCHWHLRRAIEAKLKETKLPKRDNYEPYAVHHQFPFIDINFNPSNTAYKATRFCPKEHHENIWNLINKHLHQHPLIPPYATACEIRKNAVFEIYSYCKKNSLVWMWSYLWREWYCWDRWILWARSVYDILSILKTTMFVEGHWKVLKRDFLYKFFRPRLDLLVYTLLEKLIPLQLRKFYQQLSGRETLDWKKSIKSEWKKLAQRQLEINDNSNRYNTSVENWVCGCPYFLTNRFMVCKHLVNLKGPVDDPFFKALKRNNQYPFLILNTAPVYKSCIQVITNDIYNNHHAETNNTNTDIFKDLINITQQTLDLLEEQKQSKNILWAHGVERNFNQIKNMVNEINQYKRRRTMPRTWKDHTHNTRYLK